MNVSNRCNDIVSNASIRDNNNNVVIKQSDEHKIIKFVEVDSLTLFVVAISFID